MKWKEYFLNIKESVNVDLVKNAKYTIPSNLGGSFTIKYLGKKGNKHRFESLTPGWNKGIWKYYEYTDEQVNKNVTKQG